MLCMLNKTLLQRILGPCNAQGGNELVKKKKNLFVETVDKINQQNASDLKYVPSVCIPTLKKRRTFESKLE